MSTRNIVIVTAIAVIVVLGIWMSKSSTPAETTSNTVPPPAQMNPSSETPPPDQAMTPAAETINNCTRMFDREKLKTATVDIANRFVTFDVRNFGNIQIELYNTDAPKTVENFLRLVNSGFYDCLTFHRVSKGFVIQGGDPLGTGTGGESAFGGEFADELNPDTTSYKTGYVKGVVAMANHGPNTNSSQFFIMIGDVALPHAYTIFGKVVDGLGVAEKIGQVEIIPQLGPTDGMPKEKVVIEKATISTK